MVSSLTPSSERRVAVRQLSNWEGRCERTSGTSDQLWWFAQVHDLSATGVGLLLRQRFEPGTRLLIELVSPDQHWVQRFHARVVHATPEKEKWLVGCMFESAGETQQATGFQEVGR
jgi:hypothetical protein